MFDIGFSELVLVFVIGLIVLGPQRLPVAVKTVVGWIRAIRSLAANVQHELAQELKLQELQESLKKVEEAGRGTLSPELKESMEELRKTADSMKRSVSQSIDIEKEEDEANTIHSAQHRYAPEPAATETAATPASAEHQASAPAQAPSAVAGADAAVQPAPAAAAQRPSAAPSAPAAPSSAAPAAVASAPAQAPAGDAARSSGSARPSATSSSAGDER